MTSIAIAARGGHGIVARPDLWTSVLDNYLKR